jgi:type IV pilus assembly protein PilW
MNRRFLTQPLKARRSMAGLSLIELMISITIGMIILTAVALVFSNASRTRAEVERTSRQIENGRYAIELLSDDIKLAGFYGELNVNALCGTCSPAVPNPPTALPDPCSTTVANWRNAVPVHLQGYNDNTSDVVTPPASCLPTSLGFQPGTDIVVVRRARTCAAGVGGCDAATSGVPYIQVSLCANETTSHVLGLEGTAAFDLTKKACDSSDKAVKRQYYKHIYFVGTDNGSGVNIPTLKRLELCVGESDCPASGWRTSPLVEGIEQFNVEYGLDTDGDGAPDKYVDNPNDEPAGACDDACRIQNWMNVVTVQLFVLARNLDPTPDYADSKTYQLGNLAYTPTATAYRRHVYSGLVRIVNPSARRDQP